VELMGKIKSKICDSIPDFEDTIDRDKLKIFHEEQAKNIDKGEWFFLGTPKEISACDFLKRKELVNTRPEAQKDSEGNCLHVNKVWYNLYAQCPDIFYTKFCSDCNKVLTSEDKIMTHDEMVAELADSTYEEHEKQQLLINFEEVNT
jgi:hypothetical protein